MSDLKRTKSNKARFKAAGHFIEYVPDVKAAKKGRNKRLSCLCARFRKPRDVQSFKIYVLALYRRKDAGDDAVEQFACPLAKVRQLAKQYSLSAARPPFLKRLCNDLVPSYKEFLGKTICVLVIVAVENARNKLFKLPGLFYACVNHIFQLLLDDRYLRGEPLYRRTKIWVELFHEFQLCRFNCAAQFFHVARKVIQAYFGHFACRALAVFKRLGQFVEFFRPRFHKHHHSRKRFLPKQRYEGVLLLFFGEARHVVF